jgi:hypothetical protein
VFFNDKIYKMKKFIYLSAWLLIMCGLFFTECFAQGETTWGSTWWGTTWWETTVGVILWWECLTGVWKGCFDYESVIWINKNRKKFTALSIVQDVIYAATYMVWTVLTAVIIWCGLWYIIAARWWKDTNAYRKWLINGAIWAILVLSAYAIVRLIQYIAKW